MATTYDFAIIGAGVSGGRIAAELTRSGASVVMLEAGREYDRTTFPRRELDYSTQLFWGGGLEVSRDGNMGFLRARCVGGTSIVNQALLDRFDDRAWTRWREASGIDFLTSQDMEAHYVANEAELDVSPVPEEHYNRNTHIFTEAFDKLGYGWKPLRRAQSDCRLDQGTDCMACLGGCRRDSKQSALITTIRTAREHGLELQSEWEVHHIVPGAGEVRVLGTRAGDAKAEVTARKVVLAAGAVGNSAILLRSPLLHKLPAAGTRFSCHPQYMSYGSFGEEVIDAHKGAFQAVKSDDERLRAAGYKLENVFAPPIGTAMLMPGQGREHMRRMRQFRTMASMEVAIQDDASGTITIDGKDRVVIDKRLTHADRGKASGGLQVVRKLFEAAGATDVIQCEQAFGLHLMGGCPMGTDPATSVVGPDFRVHGHDDVFAADSSVFPAAPGINPSFTIMALSHRAAKEMVA